MSVRNIDLIVMLNHNRWQILVDMYVERKDLIEFFKLQKKDLGNNYVAQQDFFMTQVFLIFLFLFNSIN